MHKLALAALLLSGCASTCPPGTSALSASTAAIVADNEAYVAADTKLTPGEKTAIRLRNREAAALAKKLAEACK